MKRSSRILVLAGSVMAMAAVVTPKVAEALGGSPVEECISECLEGAVGPGGSPVEECISECFERQPPTEPGKCGPNRELVCVSCNTGLGCGCAAFVCCGSAPDDGLGFACEAALCNTCT